MGIISKMSFDHLIGREVGTAVLIRELARGGMGIIFIAYQKSLKRQIAVKILPKSIITPLTAEFFRQEAESAAILSHPNIIQVFEVGETEEFLFFTMQLVRGYSLDYYIKRARKNPIPSRRALPVRSTLKIIIQVLDALDYAHSQGIIHRDVKPGNVLMESHTKRPILMDFGLAKVIRADDPSSSMMLGTPIYMAPEQILKREIDSRADIYAVGTMLFEMLVPGPLFVGMKSATELLTAKIKLKDKLFKHLPSELNPHLRPEIDQIILKATRYDPEERFPNCREFRSALEQYMVTYVCPAR